MSRTWNAWRGVVLALAMIGGGVALRRNRSEWPPIGEPSAASRTSGRWLWSDLVTTNVARSRDFYAKVFGWDFRASLDENGKPGYLTILANGRPIGGMVAPRTDAAVAGARWIGTRQWRSEDNGSPRAGAWRRRRHGASHARGPRRTGRAQ